MGCGEQNLAKMMPNILILEYLNVSRSKEEFDEGLRKTLVKNIKQGYLNQGQPKPFEIFYKGIRFQLIISCMMEVFQFFLTVVTESDVGI